MLQEETWQIKLEDYYGPLSVLLELIEKNHMAVLKLDLALITKQYLQYVNDLQKQALTLKQLDEISEYLNLAHYLIYLKSKYLVQGLKQEDQEQLNAQLNQEYLTKLLLIIQQYKTVMGDLKQKQDERILMLSKTPDHFESFIDSSFNYEKLPNKIDSKIFLKYLENFEALKEQEIEKEYEVFDISTSEIQDRILVYLMKHQSANFWSMLTDFYQEQKFYFYYLVSLFVATLALCNEQKINLKQEKNELILVLNKD